MENDGISPFFGHFGEDEQPLINASKHIEAPNPLLDRIKCEVGTHQFYSGASKSGTFKIGPNILKFRAYLDCNSRKTSILVLFVTAKLYEYCGFTSAYDDKIVVQKFGLDKWYPAFLV